MIEHRGSARNGYRVHTTACAFCGERIEGTYLSHHLRSECAATQTKQDAADEDTA